MISKKELYDLIQWLDERRGCPKCLEGDWSELEQLAMDKEVDRVLAEMRRNTRQS